MLVDLNAVAAKVNEYPDQSNYTEEWLDKQLDGLELDEEEKAIKKAAFYNLSRVMRAKSSSEIEDLSVEDILDCFMCQSIFAEVYEGDKAPHYFGTIQDSWPKIRTARKRRVL